MTRRGILALLLLAGTAHAHEAPQGWSYPPDCCGGGPNGDCAAVEDETVQEVRNGYRILLRPGDHPMVKGPEPYSATLAHGDPRIRRSPDSQKHICLRNKTLYCVWVPPGST